MVEELGVELLQMMENAGRALASVARSVVGGDVRGKRIVVLAGSGGNGGGGLAAARRLAVWGADVAVLVTERGRMADASRRQLEILDRIGVPATEGGRIPDADLLVDALLGYSARGAPRGRVAELIRLANEAGVPILALDLPSGLDPDSGEAHEPAIRAARTLTLALPKAGLVLARARVWVGELYLADISIPPAVYASLGVQVGALFAEGDIIRVTP